MNLGSKRVRKGWKYTLIEITSVNAPPETTLGELADAKIIPLISYTRKYLKG